MSVVNRTRSLFPSRQIPFANHPAFTRENLVAIIEGRFAGLSEPWAYAFFRTRGAVGATQLHGILYRFNGGVVFPPDLGGSSEAYHDVMASCDLNGAQVAIDLALLKAAFASRYPYFAPIWIRDAGNLHPDAIRSVIAEIIEQAAHNAEHLEEERIPRRLRIASPTDPLSFYVPCSEGHHIQLRRTDRQEEIPCSLCMLQHPTDPLHHHADVYRRPSVSSRVLAGYLMDYEGIERRWGGPISIRIPYRMLRGKLQSDGFNATDDLSKLPDRYQNRSFANPKYRCDLYFPFRYPDGQWWSDAGKALLSDNAAGGRKKPDTTRGAASQSLVGRILKRWQK